VSRGQTISLVLGSGGARGLAHIGVIEALEAEGYEIRSIAGCSMGALVGGVHAMGKLAEYRDWVCALERMDVLRLLDFSFSNSGLIKGERIIEILKELVGDTRIEDLPFKFTAVATDLDAQREVWLDRGPLYEAIRASIAVPTVFPPYRRGERLLVDGGLLNPVPIGPTLRDDTELTIAVDLSGRPDPKLDARRKRAAEPQADGELDTYRAAIHGFVDKVTAKLANSFDWDSDRERRDLGLFEIVNRSFDVMQGTVSRMKLAAYRPDLLIEIPRNVCLTYEYYRAREVIDAGREQTERALAARR
jgi:NTE family protein